MMAETHVQQLSDARVKEDEEERWKDQGLYIHRATISTWACLLEFLFGEKISFLCLTCCFLSFLLCTVGPNSN